MGAEPSDSIQSLISRLGTFMAFNDLLLCSDLQSEHT